MTFTLKCAGQPCILLITPCLQDECNLIKDIKHHQAHDKKKGTHTQTGITPKF